MSLMQEGWTRNANHEPSHHSIVSPSEQPRPRSPDTTPAPKDTDIVYLDEEIFLRHPSRRGRPFTYPPDKKQLYDGYSASYTDGIIDFRRAVLRPDSIPPDAQAYLALVDRLRCGRDMFTPHLLVGEIRAGAKWLEAEWAADKGIYIDPVNLPSSKQRSKAEATSVPLWRVLLPVVDNAIVAKEDREVWRLRQLMDSLVVNDAHCSDAMLKTNIRAHFPPYIHGLIPEEFIMAVYALYDPGAHPIAVPTLSFRVSVDLVDLCQYGALLRKARVAVIKKRVPRALLVGLRDISGGDSEDESEDEEDWSDNEVYGDDGGQAEDED